MKVEEVNNGFKPIEIKLTIESEQELCSLWHRFNITSEHINKNTKVGLRYDCDNTKDNYLWVLLDEKVSELDLRI